MFAYFYTPNACWCRLVCWHPQSLQYKLLFDTKKPTTSQKPTATPRWRSTLTNPDCCQSPSSTRDVRTSRPEATQLWRLWWPEEDVNHTSTLLILIFIGTVSATYGTLIVLAISFAIAAIGKTTLLEVISESHVPSFCQVPCSTTACSRWGNEDIAPPSTIPGTWLCFHDHGNGCGSNWRAKNDFCKQASADEPLRPGAGCQCPQTFAPEQHRVRAEVNNDLK